MHWLSLQTLAVIVPVTAEVLPIRDIVLYTFHKGSPDLLLALSFVSQLLLAGSHSDVFQLIMLGLETFSCHCWLRSMLPPMYHFIVH